MQDLCHETYQAVCLYQIIWLQLKKQDQPETATYAVGRASENVQVWKMST